MGQSKSKSWRRLSESDCLHLLNDDDLNNINHNNNQNQNNNNPFVVHGQQQQYHHTITNGQQYPQPGNQNLDHLFGPGPGQMVRNRASSIASPMMPSTAVEAQLLKFQKFDNNNNEFTQQQLPTPKNPYNKNLYEPDRKTGSLVRKSLPPAPAGSQGLAPGQLRNAAPQGQQGGGNQGQINRFFQSQILEPEILLPNLMMKAPSNLDQQVDFGQSGGLIESPPPLPDGTPLLMGGGFTSINTKGTTPTSQARPITMYQFDPTFLGAGAKGPTFNRSSLARGLSLSDLLEQCNAFEDDEEDEDEEGEEPEEFSNQTLVGVTTTDDGDRKEEEEEEEEEEDLKKQKDPTNNNQGSNHTSQDCILVDISDPNDQQGPKDPGSNNNKPQASATLMMNIPPECLPQIRVQGISGPGILLRGGGGGGNGGGAVRCSGLDCICDRCIAHRFKLLNWLLPNCTRINAERLLHGRMEGTFLVRKSEKFPGQYTLSFVCRRTVRHCLIMRSVYGFGLRWPYSFETLQQVIIHYARTTLAEFNSKLDVRLRYPVFMS